MSDAATLLHTHSAGALLEWILFFSGIIGSIIACSIKVYRLFEKARLVKNELEEKDSMLYENTKEITAMKHDIVCLFQATTQANEKLNELASLLLEMQDKNDAKERATLKDRIRQAYSFYKEQGYWNDMQKETLEELLNSYEKCGGSNSFVHSVVQKEMYTWDLVHDIV